MSEKLRVAVYCRVGRTTDIDDTVILEKYQKHYEKIIDCHENRNCTAFTLIREWEQGCGLVSSLVIITQTGPIHNFKNPLCIWKGMSYSMSASRITLVFLGIIAFSIGIIGIFLPITPTTPFLLAAGFCLSKSSPRFYKWFINTAVYRDYLNTFATERKMPLKTKLSILLPATGMMAAAFVISPWWYIRLILSFLCICKYVYFFTRISTVKEPSKNIEWIERNNRGNNL